jgi:hypothetical protein
MLSLHLSIGILLLLTAVAAIFWKPARTYVVYVLVVQVLLGAGLLFSGRPIEPLHYILAILVGGLWPMANVFEKRGRPAAWAIGACVVAVLVLVEVFRIGWKAAAVGG